MQSNNVNRAVISKTVTTEAGRGNVDGVKSALDHAEKEGFLREELIRAGIRTAARRNQAGVLRVIILKAFEKGLLDTEGNTLRVGLQDASKLGHEAAAVELLKAGAKTDITGTDGSTALYWSVTQPTTEGHLNITSILLSQDYANCPADTEFRDLKDGYTALMSAALKGHDKSLTILLKHGADVNARDNSARTILHIVGASPDSARLRWNEGTANVILGSSIDIDAKDAQGRTALHWACSTNKEALVTQLLTAKAGRIIANPNLRTSRGKTALHLACAANPVNERIVDLLLQAGAVPDAISDGGWTSLHYAVSAQGGEVVVDRLLKRCPVLLNSATSTGATALHIAAQSGEAKSVEHLLRYPECKIHATDVYDRTALMTAATGGHTEIVDALAPVNNTHRLSQYAIDACQGFDATIVDMRMKSEHKVLVQKRSVYDVLYSKAADGTYPVTTSVHKLKHQPDFRWIHLPANNIAWVKALLTKAFIEEGASDVEAYRAMERIWRHQHRGPKHPFMRPLCERGVRRSGIDTPSFPVYERTKDTADYASSPERLSRFVGRSSHAHLIDESGSGSRTPISPKAVVEGVQDDSASSPSGVLIKSRPISRPKQRGRKSSTLDSSSVQEPQAVGGARGIPPASRIASFPISDVSIESREDKETGGSNIAYVMPYLHYETDGNRRKMQEAARAREAGSHPGYHAPSCPDEALVYAYMGSTTGLHLRRTLDQSWLSGVETDMRDEDQVVGRWCRSKGIEERIVMVDQLWLFIIGPKLVITAFPQRWQQPKRDDPLDLIEGIIQDASQPSSVSSIHDFVCLITARASGTFDRHISHPDYKFMDIFEASIGNIADAETRLYSEFYKASATVHAWLKHANSGDLDQAHSLSSDSRRYPAVVDQFLDIGAETSLLQEVKDIRDELAMLSMVLAQQQTHLPLLQSALLSDIQSTTMTAIGNSRTSTNQAANRAQRDLRRSFDSQTKLITTHLLELTRMTNLASTLSSSLLNLLDLKQKQANAFEARFARDQAAGTVRQGQIIMVFTMVTIVFLPMSFLAAWFAIPIVEFPSSSGGGGGEGTQGLRLGWVAKYTFGIGLAISVALIMVAFSVNPLASVLGKARSLMSTTLAPHRGQRSSSVAEAPSPGLLAHEEKQKRDSGIYSIGRFSQDVRKGTEQGSVRETGVAGQPSSGRILQRRSGSSVLPV